MNSNLELAVLILVWIALEAVMPNFKHYKIGMFCDKIPTVAWANKLTSKRSITEGRLLHAQTI